MGSCAGSSLGGAWKGHPRKLPVCGKSSWRYPKQNWRRTWAREKARKTETPPRGTCGEPRRHDGLLPHFQLEEAAARIMTALTLTRSDPTKNLHPYYRLDVHRICSAHGALTVSGAA